MTVQVKKQGRESTQGLVRRFTKAVQQSGVLLRTKKERFRKKEKSEKIKKRAALRREELKKKYNYLKKLGTK